jgi:hypothetical protein
MVRRILLGAMAAVTLLLALAAPASAQYGEATVTPDRVEPGGSVLFTGTGCGPNTNVDITVTYLVSYVGAEVPELLLSTSILSDDEGSFRYEYPVPDDALPGEYEILARCAPGNASQRATVEGTLDENGDLVFRAIFIIPLPGTTPTTPGTPGDDDIVRTGSDLNGLGLLGAGLLVGGGIVLFATRNRRHATA